MFAWWDYASNIRLLGHSLYSDLLRIFWDNLVPPFYWVTEDVNGEINGSRSREQRRAGAAPLFLQRAKGTQVCSEHPNRIPAKRPRAGPPQSHQALSPTSKFTYSNRRFCYFQSHPQVPKEMPNSCSPVLEILPLKGGSVTDGYRHPPALSAGLFQPYILNSFRK